MIRRLPALVLCLLVVPAASGHAAGRTPVAYHLSFDDFSFLEDCYVARSGLKTPGERKLQTVEGRFGGALYLGAVPLIVNENNMSGIDLDLVTAVIYNVAMAGRKGTGYDEPFIWGAGKLHPAYGALSFWVKGPLREGMLFNQSASSFGRLEKELIEVRLGEDGSLSASVEDARYVRHTVKTKPLWRADEWMHVVFMWDRSSGLSLWVDGKEEASTMGTDSWWENQRPGLFHLPMAQAAYDEFYLFRRPLAPGEIEALYRGNEPPSRSAGSTYDAPSAERLKRAFIADISTLPAVVPSDGSALVFTHVTPERVHDEGVAGWWLADGRYECAWPHEYGMFTIIPGDADYHADHADILPPDGAAVNYLTVEGNLDGVEVYAGDGAGEFSMTPSVRVPETTSFFFGTRIDPGQSRELRIPFTKERGTPPGYEGDAVRLPLSGDLRIHEVGLFHVEKESFIGEPGDETLSLWPEAPELDDQRYARAFDALLAAPDRSSAGLFGNAPHDGGRDIVMKPMTTLNLFSEPATGKTAYRAILLDLSVQSPSRENALLVRVPNPAVPSQLWTHAEVRLEGFDGGVHRLRLALRFDPFFLVAGDRLWVQVLATDGLTVRCGDPEWPSRVVLRPDIDFRDAEIAFSRRCLLPTVTTYSKMFEYMPWRITGRFPDVDAPENFNGPFDMVYPWQAVLKVNPRDRTALTCRELVTRRYDSNNFPPKDMTFPPKGYIAPGNAPDWAVYYRDFTVWRERIIDWWGHHQRSDGQAGGGWNDDTLVFSSDHGREGGYSDMILDGNDTARRLFNGVFEGFAESGLFEGGYCRITPMDRLHNGDFIRERYKYMIYNLGDPLGATWAMEEAWHYGKPEETPVNYGDGTAFLFGRNVLDWYWNRKKVAEPYVLEDRGGMTAKLKRASEAFSDTVFWRFTEARVHTDDQSPFGSDSMHDLIEGGFGARNRSGGVYYTHVDISLGVGWPEGGGSDLARMFEYSGGDGFRARMYSFDEIERPVTARLYRPVSGRYRVTLKADPDGDGTFETTVLDEGRKLERFGRLSFTVPPRVPLYLDVSLVEADPDPGDLPDLATSSRYVEKEGGTLRVTVHNIGSAPSGPFTVAVLDAEGSVLETVRLASLDAPLDYVPRTADVRFSGLPERSMYRIVVDRDDEVREIYGENNEAVFVSGQ